MKRRMSSYSAALSRAVAPMCQTLLRLKIWAQSDETCSARLLRGSQVARQQTDSTRVVPIAAVCAISLVVPPSTVERINCSLKSMEDSLGGRATVETSAGQHWMGPPIVLTYVPLGRMPYYGE